MEFFSDYMDEACRKRTDHDHWFFLKDRETLDTIEKEVGLKVAEVIVILEEPDPTINEYLKECGDSYIGKEEDGEL